MPLAAYTELLTYARKRKFTVGAFNSLNMETLQAVVSAAEAKDSPLIVQTYHAHLDFAGAEYMRALCGAASQNAKVKIAMGLDHGRSYEQAKLCIEAGFSGVMIDLASEDYDYNVTETKKVVALAHSRGVSVEAELGKIMDAACTVEEIAAGYTDPEIAVKFVNETKVDCLAVSIGTAHGMYKYTPKINFDLLKTLIEEVPCPIVVHGGSNTPDEEVLKMVKLGVAKLNIGTDFFNAYNAALWEYLSRPGEREISQMMGMAREAVKQTAMRKLDLLNAYRIQA
jgi:ketose-bisphosphate aldolase